MLSKVLKRNPWTKILYQSYLKHIAFFLTFLKDWICNKSSVVTPKKTLIEDRENECQISQNYILHMKFSDFYLRNHNSTQPRLVDSWARDTVRWYWSADTLFWQLSIDPWILSMIDRNIDMQSVFSWAPKVVRKCERKHWFSRGADGRSLGWAVGRSVYRHVITKFSGMGRFT